MNILKCYKCKKVWIDADDSYTDDDCGSCGSRHNTAIQLTITEDKLSAIAHSMLNDESSTDEELMNHFRGLGLTHDQADKLLRNRNHFMSNFKGGNNDIYDIAELIAR